MIEGGPAKIDVIEIKTVSSPQPTRAPEKAGGKNAGKFHYVIENTWRKNVTFRPFQDVHER